MFTWGRWQVYAGLFGFESGALEMTRMKPGKISLLTCLWSWRWMLSSCLVLCTHLHLGRSKIMIHLYQIYTLPTHNVAHACFIWESAALLALSSCSLLNQWGVHALACFLFLSYDCPFMMYLSVWVLFFFLQLKIWWQSLQSLRRVCRVVWWACTACQLYQQRARPQWSHLILTTSSFPIYCFWVWIQKCKKMKQHLLFETESHVAHSGLK